MLKIEGSELMFGGDVIKEKHEVPEQYGTYQPTAIKIPLQQLVNPKNFQTVSKELFGPFQIITEYKHQDLDTIIQFLNSLESLLTCGIVSNNVRFVNKIVRETVNGVTYCGIRGRTTGAPQNHWFGPSNDPRVSGIGTPEGILMTWTCHREVVYDWGKDGDGFEVKQS